jgi:hypothetical protein
MALGVLALGAALIGTFALEAKTYKLPPAEAKLNGGSVFRIFYYLLFKDNLYGDIGHVMVSQDCSIHCLCFSVCVALVPVPIVGEHQIEEPRAH